MSISDFLRWEASIDSDYWIDWAPHKTDIKTVATTFCDYVYEGVLVPDVVVVNLRRRAIGSPKMITHQVSVKKGDRP